MNNEEFNKNNEFQNETFDKSSDAANEKVKKEKSPVREMLEWVQAIVIAIVVAFLIRSFVFNVISIEGASMEGNLHDGDRMVVWSLNYKPKRGDIVVLKNSMTNERYWIKRVIALEGETVSIDYDTDTIYVNDEKLPEPYMENHCLCDYCVGQNGYDMKDHGYKINELTVPEGCVFVMGDNRNHSSDGREIGPVSVNDILGKATLRFWPLNSFKTF